MDREGVLMAREKHYRGCPNHFLIEGVAEGSCTCERTDKRVEKAEAELWASWSAYEGFDVSALARWTVRKLAEMQEFAVY